MWGIQGAIIKSFWKVYASIFEGLDNHFSFIQVLLCTLFVYKLPDHSSDYDEVAWWTIHWTSWLFFRNFLKRKMIIIIQISKWNRLWFMLKNRWMVPTWVTTVAISQATCSLFRIIIINASNNHQSIILFLFRRIIKSACDFICTWILRCIAGFFMYSLGDISGSDAREKISLRLQRVQ